MSSQFTYIQNYDRKEYPDILGVLPKKKFKPPFISKTIMFLPYRTLPCISSKDVYYKIINKSNTIIALKSTNENSDSDSSSSNCCAECSGYEVIGNYFWGKPYKDSKLYTMYIKDGKLGFLIEPEKIVDALKNGEPIDNRKLFIQLVQTNSEHFKENTFHSINFLKKKQVIDAEMIKNAETPKIVEYTSHHYLKFNNIYIDYINERFYLEEPEKESLEIKGALFISEVDNIFQKQALINAIKSQKIDVSPTYMDIHIKTDASLILCRKDKVIYWKQMFEDGEIIAISSKSEYNKLIYKDFIEKKAIIMSYNFLVGNSYTESWSEYSGCISNKIESIGYELSKNKNRILRKNPIISLFHWKRVLLDDLLHQTISKSTTNIREHINTLSYDFKWCVTEKSVIEDKHHYMSLFQQISNRCTLDYDVHKLVADKYTFYNKQNEKINKKHHVEIQKIEMSVIEKLMYDYFVEEKKTNGFLSKFCTFPQICTNGFQLINYTGDLGAIKSMCADENKKNITSRINSIKSFEDAIDMLEEKIEKRLNEGLNVDSSLAHIEYVRKQYKRAVDDLKKYQTIDNYLEESFSTIEEDKLNACPICLYDVNNEEFGILSCGHTYCIGCMVKMFIKTFDEYGKPKCSVCRAAIARSGFYYYNKSIEQVDKQNDILTFGSKITALSDYISKNNTKVLIVANNMLTMKNINLYVGNLIKKLKKKKVAMNKKADIIITSVNDFRNNTDLILSLDFKDVVFMDPNLENNNVHNTLTMIPRQLNITYFLMDDTVEESMHADPMKSFMVV